MRCLKIFTAAAFLALSSFTSAEKPQTWSFSNAKAVIAKKGESPKSSNDFMPSSPIASPLTLSNGEVLRLTMVFNAGSEPGVPHQAYLLVKQDETGVETHYSFNVAPSTAKGKLELAQKDIPAPFIASSSPLSLSLVVGDFTPLVKPILVPVGSLTLDYDASAKASAAKSVETPVVYGKKPEIYHTFGTEPRSPPKVITLVFLAAVLASFAGLFVAWGFLGANLSALPKALAGAPISHPLFLASLVALEGIFLLYYMSWNLFKTLTAVILVGPVAFLSGSRALREVRARRLRGER